MRFHALTQIDVASHHAGIEIISDRGDQRVLGALCALWERHGLPRRLQLDNGGPSVSPTGMGEVVPIGWPEHGRIEFSLRILDRKMYQKDIRRIRRECADDYE